MKIKTADLTDAALDWAVSAAQGDSDIHPYSSNWADGGPIIEREWISLSPDEFNAGKATAWCACMTNEGEGYEMFGVTPLIAAMRCYVASKLGDEVDIPDELLEKRFTSKEDGIDFIMEALPCDRGVAAMVWANARFYGFIRFDNHRGEFIVPDSGMLTDYAERVFGLTDEEKK